MWPSVIFCFLCTFKELGKCGCLLFFVRLKNWVNVAVCDFLLLFCVLLENWVNVAVCDFLLFCVLLKNWVNVVVCFFVYV